MCNTILKRIFIVGTARSGTTLLQNVLAGHSHIFSLPETHFFDKTLHQRWFVRMFDVIRQKHKHILANHLRELNLSQEYLTGFDTPELSKKKWGRFLLSIIDTEAKKDNKKIWLEKTPRNLHYIDFINSLETNIYFIHIHRNAEDNIASLYEVAKKYPKEFKQHSLEQCIERYKREYDISKKYLSRSNHYHVIYDNLVDNIEYNTKNICKFLKIPFEKTMLNYNESTQKLVIEKEQWKAKNFRPITKEKKSEKLFSKEELDYLRKQISDYNLEIFREA